MDRLSDHLHPVHRALHIFARLGMLADFRAWYLECRRPMSEMRSMITRWAGHTVETRTHTVEGKGKGVREIVGCPSFDLYCVA